MDSDLVRLHRYCSMHAACPGMTSSLSLVAGTGYKGGNFDISIKREELAGQMILPQPMLCPALMAGSVCSIYEGKCILQISKQRST
jgi:hypothetical protein